MNKPVKHNKLYSYGIYITLYLYGLHILIMH